MELSLYHKAHILVHFIRWRLTWDRRDTNYVPQGMHNPKFMSAKEAVKMIADGDVVLSCGMAANARCSIFYYGLKDVYLATHRPVGLTWVALGAMGARGRAPGTLEELDFPNIIKRYIGGHLETIKVQLRLAQEGHIELHCMPQGVMATLFDGQSRKEYSLLTDVGIGSFLDPRIGGGSPVVPGVGESFVKLEGDKLRYSLPPINVAMFVGSYADKEGNIYVKNAATLTENLVAAKAAKANGGKVLVSVYDIIPKDEKEIFLDADKVDAIVVNPYAEQTGSVPMKRYWPIFTVGANEPAELWVHKLKFGNELMKITPTRKPPELAMARVAANVFTGIAKKGAEVNIGVGLPEEVCRMIREGGLSKDVIFGTETGVWGGLPAPGVFFGAAINPRKMMSSFDIFKFWENNLDVTILGVLEADSDGNINVSKRGEGPINYVGPGGLPNLVNCAKAIIFIGSWMAGGEFEIENGKLVIKKKGQCKFMDAVDQITFSGKRALELGKKVYYVTNVGVFHLTERGMELEEVMPGIDVQKDIIDGSCMKIVLPEQGVKVIDKSLVTGEGFKLKWQT